MNRIVNKYAYFMGKYPKITSSVTAGITSVLGFHLTTVNIFYRRPWSTTIGKKNK
jgi:hypothetical protein